MVTQKSLLANGGLVMCSRNTFSFAVITYREANPLNIWRIRPPFWRAIHVNSAPGASMDTSDTNYFNWSHERLVDRVTELEQCLRELTAKYHI